MYAALDGLGPQVPRRRPDGPDSSHAPAFRHLFNNASGALAAGQANRIPPPLGQPPCWWRTVVVCISRSGLRSAGRHPGPRSPPMRPRPTEAAMHQLLEPPQLLREARRIDLQTSRRNIQARPAASSITRSAAARMCTAGQRFTHPTRVR